MTLRCSLTSRAAPSFVSWVRFPKRPNSEMEMFCMQRANWEVLLGPTPEGEEGSRIWQNGVLGCYAVKDSVDHGDSPGAENVLLCGPLFGWGGWALILLHWPVIVHGQFLAMGHDLGWGSCLQPQANLKAGLCWKSCQLPASQEWDLGCALQPSTLWCMHE